MASKQKKRLQNNQINNFTMSNIILVAIVVLIIGVVIGMSLNTQSTNSEHQNTSVTPSQTVFASNTLKIAKEFACSCGTCGEKNLVACVCGTAIGTKQFIAKMKAKQS